MATVVLTAVGTVLGGPIGAAIGAVIGNVIDNQVLFKPKGREGSRLSDLQVQTSSYGTQVPKIFGTMRGAGTVIWATDLKEVKSKSGGGKGRASITTYSYSASFAVALSARAIRSIGRIWADGNLLRGAAGDFKTEVSAFRVHLGDEAQAVDPLIASAESVGLTPGHRGMAYVVFEDLALADYGNRIPSLTFEVEADEGAVSIEVVAAELSDGALGGAGLAALDGFAAGGTDVGAAIGPLVEAQGLALATGEAGLQLRATGAPEGEISADRLARRINGQVIDPVERSGGAADGVPVALSLRHYDAARDYQAGVQRVVRPGPGRQEQGMELPVVMGADDARALAAVRLGAAWTGRATMALRCDWSALGLTPGMVVTVEDVPGLWRIEEREWEAMAVRLSLRRVPGAGGALPTGASSGAIVRQVDAPHGATVLMLADLPPLRDGVASAPLLVAAASGGVGWRSAALFVMSESGEASAIGRSAGRAVMGAADAALPVGSRVLVDREQALLVTLLAEDMDLGGADEAALAQGRNLCLLGEELLQFEVAERIGPASWRLSGLRRGLRGSEWAMAAHGAGDRFLLIEEDRLVEPLTALGGSGEVGASLRLAAIGLGDVEPVEAALAIRGEALMPPAPVHLTVRGEGGGRVIGWVRRSRAGWRWSNGGDVPLGEESERYRVRVLDGERVVRSVETGVPGWTYDAAMIAADGAAGADWAVEVAQIGTLAMGRAARIAISF
ncbi:Putative phage tail protein [Sphingobium sp. AP50]|uniref:phage tail protein n=1 Tax=Sphingobium sp. AP50 TaxID=1884369 RepID=UPI0008C297FE|nr:phage tail protein [Sphingobium sp. AP50]SEI85924.1 Putative phage tail protein [Sphingobium sp. AP50]